MARKKEEDEKADKGWGDNGGRYDYYARDGNVASTYVRYEEITKKDRYTDSNRRKREYTPRRRTMKKENVHQITADKRGINLHRQE